MNNITRSIIISSLVLFAGAQSALAIDVSKVVIKTSETINKDCMVHDGYEPVMGCFANEYKAKAGSEALVPTPTIYLRADLPKSLLPYVFFTQFGNLLASRYSDEELAKVFNPAPDQMGFQDVRKAAASSFAYWAMGGTVTPQKLEYFKEAMAK